MTDQRQLRDDEVAIDIEGDGLSMRRLVEAVSTLLRTLESIDRSVNAEGKRSLDWQIAELSGGSAHIVARARRTREKIPLWTGPHVVRRLGEGARRLREGKPLPADFPDDAKEGLMRLIEIAEKPTVSSIRLRIADEETRLDRSAAIAQHVIEAGKMESWGSAEGVIEMMTIHVQSYFNLYDDVTGTAIRCYFPRQMYEEVHASFGRRVHVDGMLTRDADAEKESIRVDSMWVFPPDDELPRAEDVIGMLNA